MTCHWRVMSPGLGLYVRTVRSLRFFSECGPDKVTEDDHDSPDRTAVTHTARWSLVIGPVDRCKGPSRENEQANTHNEHAAYLRWAGRVKTGVTAALGSRPGALGSHQRHSVLRGGTAPPAPRLR